MLVEAAWFAVAVFVLVLGIAFAIVGAGSERTVREVSSGNPEAGPVKEGASDDNERNGTSNPARLTIDAQPTQLVVVLGRKLGLIFEAGIGPAPPR